MIKITSNFIVQNILTGFQKHTHTHTHTQQQQQQTYKQTKQIAVLLYPYMHGLCLNTLLRWGLNTDFQWMQWWFSNPRKQIFSEPQLMFCQFVTLTKVCLHYFFSL